jgi:ATP-dependent helicase HrpB
LRETDGDVLAFLPGVAEITRVAAGVAARLGELDAVDLLPLHGGLSLPEQDRALRPDGSGRRRVVLATDIAETSLTIDGIAAVVDCGLTRKPRFQPGSGLTHLVTEPISRASAEQRAGRAGRLGPGVCYRAWTRAQEQGRPAHRPAEILQADLAPLALELALWGVADPQALRWLDPPPAGAWAQGVDLLRLLGALDASGKITNRGRRMAALPLHPRLARMLDRGGSARARGRRDLAALLEERDPWINRRDLPRPVDLRARLGALTRYATSSVPRASMLAVCKPLIGSANTTCVCCATTQAADTQARRPARSRPTDGDPGALLALAYPDRIAQKRPNGGGTGERFLLSGGAGAALPRGDALAIEPYLVVADLDAASGDNRIRAALAVSETALRTLLAERIQEQQILGWDQQREAVTARVELRLDALVLESRTAPIRDLDAALQILLEQIAGALDQALNWTPAARQLQARVLLARRMQPDADWPDLSRDWLRRHVADWLAPWLVGKTRFADARALDLVDVLQHRLGWQRVHRLDELAPERLTTPAGTQRRIDYCASGDAEAPSLAQAAPVLAAPMQELYGSADTPTIFDGRLPLLLHLLSPAGVRCRSPATWPDSGTAPTRSPQGDAWTLPETPLAGEPAARTHPGRLRRVDPARIPAIDCRRQHPPARQGGLARPAERGPGRRQTLLRRPVRLDLPRRRLGAGQTYTSSSTRPRHRRHRRRPRDQPTPTSRAGFRCCPWRTWTRPWPSCALGGGNRVPAAGGHPAARAHGRGGRPAGRGADAAGESKAGDPADRPRRRRLALERDLEFRPGCEHRLLPSAWCRSSSGPAPATATYRYLRAAGSRGSACCRSRWTASRTPGWPISRWRTRPPSPPPPSASAGEVLLAPRPNPRGRRGRHPQRSQRRRLPGADLG